MLECLSICMAILVKKIFFSMDAALIKTQMASQKLKLFPF